MAITSYSPATAKGMGQVIGMFVLALLSLSARHIVPNAPLCMGSESFLAATWSFSLRLYNLPFARIGEYTLSTV